jgi:hypothetical protein
MVCSGDSWKSLLAAQGVRTTGEVGLVGQQARQTAVAVSGQIGYAVRIELKGIGQGRYANLSVLLDMDRPCLPLAGPTERVGRAPGRRVHCRTILSLFDDGKHDLGWRDKCGRLADSFRLLDWLWVHALRDGRGRHQRFPAFVGHVSVAIGLIARPHNPR